MKKIAKNLNNQQGNATQRIHTKHTKKKKWKNKNFCGFSSGLF